MNFYILLRNANIWPKVKMDSPCAWLDNIVYININEMTDLSQNVQCRYFKFITWDQTTHWLGENKHTRTISEPVEIHVLLWHVCTYVNNTLSQAHGESKSTEGYIYNNYYEYTMNIYVLIIIINLNVQQTGTRVGGKIVTALKRTKMWSV